MKCTKCGVDTTDICSISMKRYCEQCFDEECIVETRINLTLEVRKLLLRAAKLEGFDYIEDYIEAKLSLPKDRRHFDSGNLPEALHEEICDGYGQDTV